MRKLTMEIKQDDSPESPRECDNLGRMVCFGRAGLGDVHGMTVTQAKELYAKVSKSGVALPLFLYDHSGLTIATKPFSCPWDSGQIGFIYADREMILKMFGKSKMTKGMKGATLEQLENEVKAYDQYLTGDVYGYVIKDEEGDCVDSCWGFYGEEDAKTEGASALKWQIENDAKQIEEARSIMAL